MASTRKKVLVRKADRTTVPGFVDSEALGMGRPVELLTPEGQLMQLPESQIRAVYFVSSFDALDATLQQRTFSTRPRMDGLWLRLRFHDNEVLEGVTPNNLLELGGSGLMIVPPDASSGVQRIYVPRAAVSHAQVLGVIGSQRRERQRAQPEHDQIDLFK